MVDTLQWVLIGLAVPVIIVLVITTVRRARSLSERIDEYHEEQDAQQQTPGPVDPYDALSRIIDIRPKPEKKKRNQDK